MGMKNEAEEWTRQLAAQLSQNGRRICTAESCTGGLIAKTLTDLAGSSNWFDRGFVTYSNRAKVEMLDVHESTLLADGAVSEAAVREMAEGAIARSNAAVSVSISGVAGPDGGTALKPVGTVCIGWALRHGETRTSRVHCPGHRELVRRQAVRQALEGVVEIVTASAVDPNSVKPEDPS